MENINNNNKLKRFNKLFITIILIMLLMQITVGSFAANKAYNPIIIEQDEKHLIYENNNQYADKMLEISEQTVYRLSSEDEGNNNYVSDNFVDFENEAIMNLIKFGYPNYSKEELNCNTDFEAYVATQEAIYTIYNNRNIRNYVIKDEKGQRIYNAMEQIIQRAQSSQFEENLSVQIDLVNKEKVEDEEYVRKEYKITMNRPIMLGILSVDVGDGVKLSKTEIHGGENFELLIPKDKVSQNVSIKLVAYMKNFNMKLGTNAQEGSGQIYLQPTYSNKEYKFNLIKAGNNSTIKITNIDKQTKTPICGNKFQLLNRDLEVVKDALVTDINGQIIVKNITNGIYYLQQTEAIEGYCINKTKVLIQLTGDVSVINVKIVSDSEKNETVENLEKEINLEEENKNIEEINNKEITNIYTNNIYKDIINHDKIKEQYNNNGFFNTTNIKDTYSMEKNNIYLNTIEQEFREIMNDSNVYTKNMTKDDFINFMELVTSNIGVERIPEAGI